MRKNGIVVSDKIRHDEFSVPLLIQSGQKKYDILDALPDYVLIVSKDLRIVYANAAFRKWDAEYRQHDNFEGRLFPELYPDLADSFLDKMECVLLTGTDYSSTITLDLNNERRYLEVRKIPMARQHETGHVMIITRDITRRKLVEQVKLRTIERKEVMVKEIHHRVKNNLSMLIGMIGIEIFKNPVPGVRIAMEDIENRIRSMVLIHDNLYISDNREYVPFGKYLHSLSSAIVGTFGEANILLTTDLEPVDVPFWKALPLGLITNELITNSIKYAFPGFPEGELTIRFRHEAGGEGSYKLSIIDNGIGLPENFSIDKPASSGMLIVKMLIEQLDARLEIVKSKGTGFHIYLTDLKH